jgi:Uma2 family endonuclease
MIPKPRGAGAGRLTRGEFRSWVAQQPQGRYERVGGQVVAMSPERIGHALIKGRVWRALDAALLAAQAPCSAIPDGAAVEIDDDTDYEPDGVVSCDETLDLDAVVAPTPVIVVEVTSPGTRGTDNGAKLADYFRVASIQHYLSVNSRRVEVIHHRREPAGAATRIVTGGSLPLDPRGIAVPVDAFYAGLSL